MENPAKSSFEELIDSTKAYSKTTLELSTLKTLNSTAKVISVLTARLCLLIACIIFLVIISIGVALLLNEWLGKPYYGFFVLSGFYLIVVIVFYFFLPKWINKPFSDLIISEALD
jgi:hypothetical protein